MDSSDGTTKHRWVCPSDRHLALRAKLRTGWSVKTQPLEILPKAQEPTVLDESEQAMILDVIRRAEHIDLTEQERVGRLVDRVDNMKRNAMGNGANQCILCGTKFGFLGSTSYLCHDCQKFVCSKCSIETCSSSSSKEQIWLCKICSETREMWKKSGAWFFKAAGGETENDSSSEDELMRRSRLNTGASIASAASGVSATSAVSGLSAASGASAISATSSQSSVSASMSGSTVKAAIGNNNTTFGRDSFSRKSSWRDWQTPLLSSDETSASSDCLRLPRSVSGHTIAAAKPDDIPTLLGAHGSAQLGSVELSLLYDRHSGCLHCRLLRAMVRNIIFNQVKIGKLPIELSTYHFLISQGLKSTDINGLADPFCKLNLLPAGNKNNRLRTQTIHKTCNPEFNESLTFYNITDGDMATKALHVLILDDDKYGHDFLGEARIQLSGVPPQHARHFKVFLDKHYPVEDEEAAWGEDLWTRGQILVTLCYSTKRRALIVGIVRCLNLTPMDSNGSSDPFVKLQLKPDPHHRKYKTGIKWQSLNPLYNEEFVFDTKMTELQQKTLVITVWDKDHGKSNDYLGGLELSCLSKGERLRHWVDAIKFPDHKHEGWHQLVDTSLPL
ncbi:hypothetical protein FOCC_FOCC012831 [Frankliniella occidentalis]|nr:hypothetical protein FOCC_FOCC012831 [Frankliniella occidentalis]